MMSKNTVIGALVFSAVLLSCVLVLVNLAPRAAHAGTTSRAGSFAVASARTNVGIDLLWIAHVDSQRLVVFGADRRGNISALARADLRTLFERSRQPASEGAVPGNQ